MSSGRGVSLFCLEVRFLAVAVLRFAVLMICGVAATLRSATLLKVKAYQLMVPERLTSTFSCRDLPSMAASQTADVEDRAGRGHGTDANADRADAADGAE